MEKDKFVVIQSWMLNYDLSTKELLTYAVIYGFSQDEKSSFYGSLQYLADWTKTSKSQVQVVLKKLLAKGLLNKSWKFENNIKQCFYQALRPNIEDSQDKYTIPTISTGDSQDKYGYTDDNHAPIPTTATNNKYIINLKERENKGESLSQDFSNPTFEQMSEEEKAWTIEQQPKAFSDEIFNVFKKGAMPCANGNDISFLMRDFKNGMAKIRKDYSYLTHEEIIKACKNYVTIVNSPQTYLNTKLSFERFVQMKNFADFLPANFIYENFISFDKKKQYEEENQQQQQQRKRICYDICLNCKNKSLYWSNEKQVYVCEDCGATYSYEEISERKIV